MSWVRTIASAIIILAALTAISWVTGDKVTGIDFALAVAIIALERTHRSAGA